MITQIVRYLKLWIHFTLYLSLPIAIFFQNWTLLFATVLTITFIKLGHYLFKKNQINLPIEFEWAIGIFIYLTLFLGDGLEFYDRIPHWDTFLHTTSGFILGISGFLMMYTLYKAQKINTHLKLLAIFSFSFALAIGALWELFEYSVDIFIIKRQYMQGGGLDDTMIDLFVDAVGALVASIWGYFYMKDNKYSFDVFLGKFVDKNPHLFRGIQKIATAEDKIKSRMQNMKVKVRAKINARKNSKNK